MFRKGVLNSGGTMGKNIKFTQKVFCLFLLLSANLFTSCATPVRMAGIHNINEIQIQPATLNINQPKINVNVGVKVSVDSKTGASYDLVIQRKLESSLVTSLKSLNIFQNVQTNLGERSDLSLSANFFFTHKAIICNYSPCQF